MKTNSHLLALLTFLLAANWVSISHENEVERNPVSSEGATLFGSRCAHCHGSGVIQPDIKGLSKLKTEEIYHTLWSGIMREAANGLDDVQQRSIAEYVASLSPYKASEKINGYCGKDALAAGSPIVIVGKLALFGDYENNVYAVDACPDPWFGLTEQMNSPQFA